MWFSLPPAAIFTKVDRKWWILSCHFKVSHTHVGVGYLKKKWIVFLLNSDGDLKKKRKFVRKMPGGLDVWNGCLHVDILPGGHFHYEAEGGIHIEYYSYYYSCSALLVEVVVVGKERKREFPMVCITSHDRGSLYIRDWMRRTHTRGSSPPPLYFSEKLRAASGYNILPFFLLFTLFYDILFSWLLLLSCVGEQIHSRRRQLPAECCRIKKENVIIAMDCFWFVFNLKQKFKFI